MVFGNMNNFWKPMLDLLQHMRGEGFVHTAHLVQPLVVEKAEDIVPAILAAATGANGREGEAEIISRL
ncbi:hypothetical protein D3C72_2535600 [compost metagenome]